MKKSIKFKVDGKIKEFVIKEFTIEKHLLAMKHQIAVSGVYSDPTFSETPENYEKMQIKFLELIVSLFDNDFSLEELKQAPADLVKELEEVHVLALGGKLENDDEKKTSKP